MSNTSPVPGSPDPAHPNPASDPVNVLAPRQPGSPRADEHGTSGPPAAEVVARGYEADVYDPRSVMSVPLMVILFFVLAFGTVTTVFYFIAPSPTDPRTHPQAAERNKAPLNERLDRIHRGGEVDQARLEPLKLRSGDPRAISQPSLPTGNSPELHPEDLRPTKDRYPGLYSTGWADPGKAVGRIGIDKAMSLNDDAIKKLFPSKNGPRPIDSQHVPTAANAGRGASESRVTLPAVPEEKKEDKKPDDKKDGKPEDKKPGEKK
jgi:hypothetical protein